MPITNTLKDFVIKGIKDLKFYDANNEFAGKLQYLSDINISDTTAKAQLRGGLNNPVLMTIEGDRDVQLTANNSTLGMDQLSLMLGNKVVVKTVMTPKDEKMVAISGTTATLSGTPVLSENVTVFLSNANGEDVQKLTKVASAPTAGQFSIATNVITVAGGVTGVLNCYYFESVEAEQLSASASGTGIYKAYAKCLLQSISNKRLYAGDIVMNNVTLTKDFNIGGSNSADVPESSQIVLDLLTLNGLAPYVINCYEITSAEKL